MNISEMLDEQIVPCIFCNKELLLEEVDEHYSTLHADEE